VIDDPNTQPLALHLRRQLRISTKSSVILRSLMSEAPRAFVAWRDQVRR
jgi:hypothetical protein